jgi:DNA-binding PadR family transcriptional regulator
VWGSWLKEELFRHGYDISPGTLYPVLHELEREDLIRGKRERRKGKWVKVYRITEKGKVVLKEAQDRIKELVEEVLIGEGE